MSWDGPSLFACDLCRVVSFQPEEARIWKKTELLNIFRGESHIPKELLRSPALFLGVAEVQIDGKNVTTPAFLSSENEGFQKMSAIAEKNEKRFAVCRVCRRPVLFSPVS
jgi:hypothetical protein